MNLKVLAARFALVVTCGLMATAPAAAQFWQCAPYAREISGIDIHGNANTWWGQAAGRYERGNEPRVGAVLAFKATHRMRVGHVAMVSHVVNDREVLLTHANWSRPGRVETDVRAVDVSPNNDWSVVKVWYGLLVKAPNDVPTEADRAVAAGYEQAGVDAFAQDFEIWGNKRACIHPMMVQGDGPFHKVRIWYKQFYNPRERAGEFQSRVNGRMVTKGTQQDPWTEAA